MKSLLNGLGKGVIYKYRFRACVRIHVNISGKILIADRIPKSYSFKECYLAMMCS